MNTFTHHATIDHPRQDVTNWYASPGAIRRLSPEFNCTVLSEPTDGLYPGSTTTLLMGLPWAEGFLPKKLPVHAGATWTAVHTQYDPGTSFTDVMDRGPLRSWTHHHEFSDAGSSASADQPTETPWGAGVTTVEDRVEYELPGGLQRRLRPSAAAFEKELRRVFEYRTRQTQADLDFHVRLREVRAEPLTVVIAGASGLVGTQLSAFLRAGGHRVIELKRRTGYSGTVGEDAVAWDPAQHTLDAKHLIGADVVVNLSGASIAGPFTRKHKDAVLKSRLDATNTLVAAMTEVADQGGPHTLVSASASGFYGHDAGAVTEASAPGDDFLADVCRQWETAALEAEGAGIRVVLIRTGLVLSAAGGLLGAQLPLYLAGGGGPIGGGDMWQPWISLHDLVQIYAFAAAHPEVSGPINAAAPEPVQQKDFAKTLGKVLRRPAVIPVPKAAPGLLLGAEGARELALASVRMQPEALRETGYEFRFNELEPALRLALGRFE